MKELLIEKKNAFIALGIIIALFILLSIGSKISKDVNTHKLTAGNDYVYTLKTSKNSAGKISSLPVINLDFASIKNVNNHIQELYEQITKDTKNSFQYEFTIHQKILFVLMRMDFDDITNGSMNTRFVSVNVDLKTGTVLKNEEVLKRYGYTIQNVKDTIYNKMLANYNDSHKKGYVDTNNCDFACYLRNHDFNVNNLDGGVSLFVKNKKLVIYRGFTVDTVLGDKNYFVKEDFLFPIEK